MLVLGINTVGDACDVALVESRDAGSAHVLANRIEDMGRGHDARLAPMVQDLLGEAGVRVSALGCVAVIVGPGSFTGVRVGVAFARGIALVAGRQAVGVTSLEALDPMPPGRVLGVLPARRRPPDMSWWAQLLLDGVGQGEPVEADHAMLQELAADAEHVSGDCEVFADRSAQAVFAAPSAAAAARFALRAGNSDGHPPIPIYVRAPDAAPARPR